MERSGDRDGSAGLKFVGVELFVGSSENGGMVSIVLDEFGVGNSSVLEILVVVLRGRHESFEERGFETECRSDRRANDLRKANQYATASSRREERQIYRTELFGISSENDSSAFRGQADREERCRPIER